MQNWKPFINSFRFGSVSFRIKNYLSEAAVKLLFNSKRWFRYSNHPFLAFPLITLPLQLQYSLKSKCLRVHP